MARVETKIGLEIRPGKEREIVGGYRLTCHYSNCFDNNDDATIAMVAASRALFHMTKTKVTSIDNDMRDPTAAVAHPFDRFVFRCDGDSADLTFLSVDEPTPVLQYPNYVSERFSTHYATCTALHFVGEVIAFVVGSPHVLMEVVTTYNSA